MNAKDSRRERVAQMAAQNVMWHLRARGLENKAGILKSELLIKRLADSSVDMAAEYIGFVAKADYPAIATKVVQMITSQTWIEPKAQEAAEDLEEELTDSECDAGSWTAEDNEALGW